MNPAPVPAAVAVSEPGLECLRRARLSRIVQVIWVTQVAVQAGWLPPGIAVPFGVIVRVAVEPCQRRRLGGRELPGAAEPAKQFAGGQFFLAVLLAAGAAESAVI